MNQVETEYLIQTTAASCDYLSKRIISLAVKLDKTPRELALLSFLEQTRDGLLKAEINLKKIAELESL